MKTLFKLLVKNELKGFTLLELLLASFMTLFVVSATGYAIVLITRESLAGEVSSDLQFNTNRASDFITSEVQQSSFLSLDSSDSPCSPGTGYQFIVGLAINSTTTIDTAYYVRTPPGSPWVGPSSIYRCGLTLTSTGNYGSVNTTPQILIDSISTAATAKANSCPSGTTQFPSPPNAGFYICHPTDVGSDSILDNTSEKIIEIHLTAASDALANRGMTTTTGQGRFDRKDDYTVVTKVFARSATP